MSHILHKSCLDFPFQFPFSWKYFDFCLSYRVSFNETPPKSSNDAGQNSKVQKILPHTRFMTKNVCNFSIRKWTKDWWIFSFRKGTTIWWNKATIYIFCPKSKSWFGQIWLKLCGFNYFKSTITNNLTWLEYFPIPRIIWLHRHSTPARL